MGMVPVSQRKPHQASFSYLQTYSLSSSPSRPVTTAVASSSSSYECSSGSSNPYYSPAAPTSMPYARIEPISSIQSSLLNFSIGSTPDIGAAAIHPQESFASPLHHHYQARENLLVEASSSSSDGSGSNQIKHGKEPEYDHYGRTSVGARVEHMGLQNYIYNGLDDKDQKFMISSGSGGGGPEWSTDEQKPNGMWGEAPLDFGLEEFKQLISSNLYNNNFSFDENKTEDRAMYY